MQAIWIQKKHYKMINHSRMLKANTLMKFLYQAIQSRKWSLLSSDSKNKHLHLSFNIAFPRGQNSTILVNMIAKWIETREITTMEKKIRRNKIMFTICNQINKITNFMIILYLQSLIITSPMFKMMPKGLKICKHIKFRI